MDREDLALKEHRIKIKEPDGTYTTLCQSDDVGVILELLPWYKRNYEKVEVFSDGIKMI